MKKHYRFLALLVSSVIACGTPMSMLCIETASAAERTVADTEAVEMQVSDGAEKTEETVEGTSNEAGTRDDSIRKNVDNYVVDEGPEESVEEKKDSEPSSPEENDKKEYYFGEEGPKEDEAVPGTIEEEPPETEEPEVIEEVIGAGLPTDSNGGTEGSLRIVTEPQDVSVAVGTSISLHVAVNSNDVFYQWQWTRDGKNWKDCASVGCNTDTFSFVMKDTLNGRHYRCVITSGDEQVISQEAVVTCMVTEALEITKQPEDVTAAAGEPVSVHVEANKGGAAYQWQWTRNGNSWSNCTSAGSNTDTFSFVMKETFNGRHYRCVITSGDEQVISQEAVVTCMVTEALEITKQPEDVAGVAGETVSIHVEANRGDAAYQWQWSADEKTWKSCTSVGSNTDTFSFAMKATLNGRHYRCIVTSGNEQVISETAVVRCEESLKITEHPENITAGSGMTVRFHVEANKADAGYQWQRSDDGKIWKNCYSSGYNTDTMSFVMKNTFDGRQYRCIVTSGDEQVLSSAATLTFEEALKITSQPEDVTGAVGEIVNFHVEANKTDVTYRWQWSTDGKTWKNCTSVGYNTDTFSFTMKETLDGRYYRCKVTDAYGNYLTSDSAVLTVNEPPVELTGLYHDQLPTEEQDIYRQVYSAIASRQTDFYVQAPSFDALDSIIDCVLNDHPEFFWLSGQSTISGTSGPGLKHVVLNTNVDLSMIDSQQALIDSEAGAYLSMISGGMSNYDKVRIAYEFVVNNNDYVLDSDQNQNIQSSMIYHQSVCSGYAKEMQYLLNEAGIFCAFIEGYVPGDNGSPEPHAWNLVLIDGEYTYVDATWGDPYYGGEPAGDRPTISYSFLCLTSDEMDRLGYQPDPGYSIPQVTSSTWDYYALNGWYVGIYDRNTARNVIFAQIDSGSEYVHLKFADENSFQTAMDDIFNSDFTNEIFQYKADVSQIYEFAYGMDNNDALYTIDINWVY